MAVRLSKGQKVDLTKTHPVLRKIVVGLGWNAGGQSIDLDASAFLLGPSGKVQSDHDFIYYNNPLGANGAVRHSGDKRQGIGSGDDEQVFIDLHAIPQHIDKIAFTITIHEAEQRRQSFGQVAQAYVRIVNEENGEELLRYDLGKDFSIETAIVTAELYRYQGEWKFNAVGSGFQGGLGALCRNYGLEVDEFPATASTSWQQPFQEGYQPNQAGHPNQPFTSGWQSPGVHDWTSSQPPQAYNTPYGGSSSPSTPNGNMYSGDMARCPRCGSTQIISGKKGFGFGKAAIGGLIFGPIGLLGGFLGSKKLEFTCARCGNKWSTEAADYMKWMNTQKERARELINRYKGQDMLDAVVAGCALVASADGVISQVEKQKMVEVIQQVEELRAFDMAKVIDRFNHFTGNFQSDPMLAKAEAMRAVGKIKGKPDAARLVVRLCCAIGMADGSFDPQEKQIVSEICRELYLNPAEFIE
ncbi:TerD family protein [Aneurinibacillus sp. Ricciae_BoGa-3]|uniref:TerD family protein n=1 Tax=Aneurinibacillus sp. Ricciae_BoGa-3 TaxID=3022697 RepID=UPI002341FD11|nr:TerD family protein [Aneurinibacillus sp. Ricciae_BoGa-3]WCK55580.1 TerD family protein [Aneurinibacillus sp. Ricciae_BoGa-3]